jgi:hypothetical protein
MSLDDAVAPQRVDGADDIREPHLSMMGRIDPNAASPVHLAIQDRS